MSKRIFSALLMALALGANAGAETIESKIDELGTAKYLTFKGLSSVVKNHMLVVNVDVYNTDNDDRKAFYRFRWLDKSGDPVWEEEGWKPVLFHGNQTIHIRKMAPTPKAQDFRIEFSAEDNYRK